MTTTTLLLLLLMILMLNEMTLQMRKQLLMTME
jgi:hypothetical protein